MTDSDTAPIMCEIFDFAASVDPNQGLKTNVIYLVFILFQ